MNVGKNTAFSDRHPRQQLVQLLVITDGQLDVTGGNALLLVITTGVPGQLQDLRAQVLFP